MQEQQVRLGDDGRIVIPASYRKALHLAAGEKLIIQLFEGELHIFSQKKSLQKAQQRIQSVTKGRSLVDALKRLRDEDSQNE